MFRGGTSVPRLYTEFWILRKVPEPGGWEIMQFLS